MAFLTVEQALSKISGKLNGASLGKVSGSIYEKLEEAAATMLMRLDPASTKRSYRIENAIHDRIYNYVAPSDFKGVDGIVDLRPIGLRSTKDYTLVRSSREFDIKKYINTATIEYINGVKTLRLAKELKDRTVLSEMNSLTIPDTITGNADITNLELDYLDYITGSASVKFDLAGGGQGILTIQLASVVDLSQLTDIGAFFHWFKFPDASDLTSVVLRWGNDASNYYEKTITAPHDRSTFEDDAWLLNRYDWSSATQTGTVDETAIDYLQILINYTGAQSNIKIDSITASLGEAWELIYYSNCLFKGIDGTWKTKPTLKTDYVMLDPDAFNIFLYENAKIIGQELKGKNQGGNLTFFERELEGDGKKPGLYDRYEQRYPSEAIPVQSRYYEFGNLDDTDYESEKDYLDRRID